MLAAPVALARSGPVTSALYSVSLLVVGKSRRTIDSIVSPFGDSNTTRTPLAYLLDDLFCMYAPQRRLFCPLILAAGKFSYRVHDDLPFDGSSWAILDVKLAQLYGP